MIRQMTPPPPPPGPQAPGDPNMPRAIPNPNQPAPNSVPRPNLPGLGKVDELIKQAGQYGNLPEKERIRILRDMTRDLPPKERKLIEDYYKKVAASSMDK